MLNTTAIRAQQKTIKQAEKMLANCQPNQRSKAQNMLDNAYAALARIKNHNR